MRYLVLLLVPAFCYAASLVSGPPSNWTTWTPREEIAPRTFVDTVHYRSRPGALAISGNSNPAAYGGWVYQAQGIAPGKWYRFTAWYRQQGAPNERNQVMARLDWRKANGKRAGQLARQCRLAVRPVARTDRWWSVPSRSRPPTRRPVRIAH